MDLRFVAATPRPVDALEASGFRSDLYARLAGFTHRLPPLHARIEDLGIIVADILKRIGQGREPHFSMTPALVRALVQHTWPLNVRELEQLLAVTTVLCGDETMDVAHVPEWFRSSRKPPERGAPDALEDGERALRDTLVAALTRHAGNVTHAAKEMGKARMQVHRWMRRFGLDAETFRR